MEKAQAKDYSTINSANKALWSEIPFESNTLIVPKLKPFENKM